MTILDQFNSISRDTGQFVAGILSNDISRDDQLQFALRLAQLAEHIKERATSSVGMVIAGTAADDNGRQDQCVYPLSSSCLLHAA